MKSREPGEPGDRAKSKNVDEAIVDDREMSRKKSMKSGEWAVQGRWNEPQKYETN
jgi:hypothetical protein